MRKTCLQARLRTQFSSPEHGLLRSANQWLYGNTVGITSKSFYKSLGKESISIWHL